MDTKTKNMICYFFQSKNNTSIILKLVARFGNKRAIKRTPIKAIPKVDIIEKTEDFITNLTQERIYKNS